MTDHDVADRGDHPDLTALVRGEASNREVLAQAHHLDECAECRRDLTQVVTGHALLTRSAEIMGEGRDRTSVPAISAGDLPPLPTPRRERRGGRPLMVLVAAAAVVASVVWVGIRPGDEGGEPPVARPSTSIDSEATPSTPPPGTGPEFTRASVLRPIDSDASGDVFLADDTGPTSRIRVTVRNPPALAEDQFFYVWLLDPTTNKMLPLGQIGSGGTATFDVAADHLAAYSAVDVSVERDDGDPGHSPRSVLRATYT